MEKHWVCAITNITPSYFRLWEIRIAILESAKDTSNRVSYI